MTGEKRCPQCGLRNELDVRFCIYCGIRFPDRTCPHCDFPNDPVAGALCTNCGKRLLKICPRPQCNHENEVDALYCIDCRTPFPRVKRERIFRVLQIIVPIFLGIFIGMAIGKNFESRDDKSPDGAPIFAIKVEDSNNNPLEGVAFSLIGGPKTDYANSMGNLEIKLTKEMMPRDTLFFELNKENYRPVYDFLVIRGDSKRFEKKYVMPKVIYGIKFIMQDEAQNRIEGVSLYRNSANMYLETDMNGRAEDSFEEINAPIKYEFRKPYYQSESWTATKNLFAYSNVIEKQIQLRRLFFTVQCRDSTGIYGNDLGGIRVVNLIDQKERYADANGRTQFPLSQPGVEVKLRPSKEPIFPVSSQSANLVTVQPGQVVRINVTPIPGSLTLKILCPDGSPFKHATVIIDGNGHHDEKTTDTYGMVEFQDARIKPVELFKIMVRKGRKEEGPFPVRINKLEMDLVKIDLKSCGE